MGIFVTWWQIVTFPRHSQPVINPDSSLSLHQVKVRQSFPNSLFQTILLTRSAQADNQKMYIKSIVDQILDIIETLTHQIELGVGDTKCLARECASINQANTKSITKLSRGAFLPTCLIMSKARPSAAFQQTSSNWHLFCKIYQGRSTKWPIETLGSQVHFTSWR